MKIASNKLCELFSFYTSELGALYDKHELQSIFELVCEKYLNYSKIEVKQKFNDNINQSELIQIYNTAVSLKKGIPVQYILKEAFFYDTIFKVTNDVLIPRPETEELVDIIIKSNINYSSILDIGTGSGCIPIIFKKKFPHSNIIGIDISEKALEIAKINAKNNLTEIEFLQLDILNQEIPNQFTFNIIVSNPPYIVNSESVNMEKRVLNHEPHLALFVENNNPIVFYKRIIDLCKNHLDRNGYLYFELNPMYANDVKNYANESNLFNFTEIIEDMSGKKRFLKAQKK